MEIKKNSQLKSIQEIVCNICQTNDHPTDNCPALPAFRECLHEQANMLNAFERPNHNPYSQTYNLGRRNHPNFNWKNDNHAQSSQPQNFQNPHGSTHYVPPPMRNFEEKWHSFVKR